MAIAVTDKQDSFQSGASLWIVADLPRSSWSRRLDWYLNFQIQRSVPHQTPKLTAEMTRVLESVEYEAPKIDISTHAPLMIASDMLLPNKQTVVVSWTNSANAEREWVRECMRVWRDLGGPSLRVFIPDELRGDRFTEIWSAEMKSDSASGRHSVDIQIVEGLESKK